MNSILSNYEILIILALCSILALPIRLVNLRNKLSIVNPVFIYSCIISYYAIISPIYKIFFGSLIYRGINFRNLLIYGWIGALISSVFIIIGYFLSEGKRDFIKKRVSYPNDKQIFYLGIYISIFAYISYQITHGINLINFVPFILSQGTTLDFLVYRGDFSNYLGYSLDFLISGNMLLLIATLNSKKWRILFFINLILTCGLYLNAGFRYRLFFLLFSLLFYYLIYSEKNIKSIISFAVIGLISITFLSTFLEIVRVYGQGMNFERLQGFTFTDFIMSIFQIAETNVFLTTSAVIKYVPEIHPYVYLYPFYKVLIQPLPSSFFDKNPGDYIIDVLSEIYGSNIQAHGSAMHNFGEYYLIGGWIGLIILSFIFGFILKKLWIWGNLHKKEPLGLAVYIMNISYIFMIVSRGYLPQQAQLYAFSILPINLIYYFNSKLIKGKNIKQ